MDTIRAEIISTGAEILHGLYPDTNAREISRRMKDLGYSIVHHTVVGDEKEGLHETITRSIQRSSIVIMTGGLGPTEDDLNRSVAAEVWGSPLEIDPKAEEMIRRHFSIRNIPMPEGNLVQARIPGGAIPLYNDYGTAPGFLLHDKAKKRVLIAMPGPPREWRPMFEGPVRTFLKERFPSGRILKTLTLRTINVPESELNERLRSLFNAMEGVSLGFLAKPGKVDIRITAAGTDRTDTEQLLSDARERILSRIDPGWIYSEEEGIPIEEAVADLLRSTGRTVSLAESCTGGLITKRLTDIPGSSVYLRESIVTYSNEAKRKYLGVRQETLDTFGAVSGETASEMALGMRHASGADFSMGITGIAGPSGASPEKPVGLVYFGLSCEGGAFTWQRRFTGGRNLIRERSADFALDMLRRFLLGEKANAET